MIYRVPSRIYDGSHYGFTYCTNKRDALKEWKRNMLEECEDTGKTLCLSIDYQLHTDSAFWKKGTGFDPFDEDGVDSIQSMPTPKNQAQLLRMLYWWASHPDNG